jgi:peroxiredoxin
MVFAAHFAKEPPAMTDFTTLPDNLPVPQDDGAAGATQVWGLSSQDPGYQAEAAERLHLPFRMLSDPGFTLADTLSLPTFSAPGHQRLYTRLTIVARDGRIEHVFYPVFPPNTHAQQVLHWLRAHPIR